ncbi:MAG: hypothetical protein KBT35_01225 [Firmicutes bacterium]|nr:hypothetical protein [Candidatus Colivicinus equi]
MSVQAQITRISADRDTIRTKMVNLGLSSSSDNLDALATAVAGIANQGSPAAEIREGDTYTIQPGYYQGGTVTGVAGGGSYELQEKEATPTTAVQVVTPDTGKYGLSKVTVNAIPEQYKDISGVTAGAGDVLSGKTIVTEDGTVAGTMANNGAVNETLSISNPSYNVPAGYHNGSGVVAIVAEEKSVTPTESEQVINASTGKVISKVTVAPIPDQYADVSGVTATEDTVLAGSSFVNADGETVEGTIETKAKITATITGLGVVEGDTYYDVAAGYYPEAGRVSLTADIENALALI